MRITEAWLLYPALFSGQFIHFLFLWSFLDAFSLGSFLLHLIFFTSSFVPEEYEEGGIAHFIFPFFCISYYLPFPSSSLVLRLAISPS